MTRRGRVEVDVTIQPCRGNVNISRNNAALRRSDRAAILALSACAVDPFTEYRDVGGSVRLSISRFTRALGVLALSAVSGCAPRTSAVGTPLDGPRPTVTYACSAVLSLRVRLDASSAAVTIDGDGPYILSQTAGRSGFTVYSDGQRVLEIRESAVSFGLTPRLVQGCVSSE